MAKDTKEINIIRYDESWAKGIADMWNLSRDDWGGDARVETEENVKKKEANSENLELFLAIDGEEVAGYCGLCEYKEDTDALYIPLLNVRPDYQGKKIGKQLVLKALEKTVSLERPRLDLFTWAGNIKAVPLYKRTGFFWEERDDVTHLMNFIPLVLNTPLLRDYFKEIDWYHDSKRVIEQKPDGIKENGFTFYEYVWNNGSDGLRVQIERTGRKISLIETDEFILEMKLVKHELVEEEKHPFEIHFKNKTGVPAHVKVEGSGDGRTIYSISKEGEIEGTAVFTSGAFVNKGEEPSVWRTHPTIEIKVWINGLECDLGLGVFPTPPAAVKAGIGGESLTRPGSKMELELEVSSHLDEPAEFTLSFPEDEMVSLGEARHVVSLKGKQRAKVKVPFVLNKHGLYKPSVQISAKKADGSEICFEQDLHVAFKGPGVKFGGESREYWHIFNGMGHVSLRKRDLLLRVGKCFGEEPFAVFVPMLGVPFTNEFAKAVPESVVWEETAEGMLLNVRFASQERKGIYLSYHALLYGDGLAEIWCGLENHGEDAHEDLALSFYLYHDMQAPIFPARDGIVEYDAGRFTEFGDVRPEMIQENWYFSKNDPDPYGIAWADTFESSPTGWKFHLKEEAGVLARGESWDGGRIIVSFGAFRQWEDFRKYVQPKVAERKPLLKELSLSSVWNGGEPALKLVNYRNNHLEGELAVTVNDNLHTELAFEKEDALTAVQLELEHNALAPVSLIASRYTNPSFEMEARNLLLCPDRKAVHLRKAERDNHEVFEAGNGCLEIMAAPAFYPGVYSIQFDGAEWLDHCFPEPTVKSYWNPWAGGMKTVPSGLTNFSLSKETHSAGFAQAKDSEGNLWEGLFIKTELNEHKEWKGAAFIQYYFMLPGVPAVASFAEMAVDGGRRVENLQWAVDLFFGGVPLTSLRAVPNSGTQVGYYRFGGEELNFKWEAGSYIAASGKEEKMFYVPGDLGENAEIYTNKEAAQLGHRQKPLSEAGSRSTANFLLFDKRTISQDWLESLRNIRFEEVRRRHENH